jgi:hypothetical protein
MKVTWVTCDVNLLNVSGKENEGALRDKIHENESGRTKHYR